MDPVTKRSKRYGFVRFSNQFESEKAIKEQNGQYLKSRAMKIGVGHKKD